MTVNLDDFRSFIIRELTRRQNRNAAYSLNAFARDLGMTRQNLGQIINGKSGLSPEGAYKIATELKLEGVEKQLFLSLVQAKHGRSSLARTEGLKQAQKLRDLTHFTQINDNEFAPIAHWYHWAALHLVDRFDFKEDIDWIAKQLEIPVDKAISAYEALFAQGLLERDRNSRWRRTGQAFSFSASKSTQAIREFYREILVKAQDSINGVPVSDRHIAVAVLSIEEAQLPLLKERVEIFVRELVKEFTETQSPTECIYTAAIQLFPLVKSSGRRSNT